MAKTRKRMNKRNRRTKGGMKGFLNLLGLGRKKQSSASPPRAPSPPREPSPDAKITRADVDSIILNHTFNPPMGEIKMPDAARNYLVELMNNRTAEEIIKADKKAEEDGLGIGEYYEIKSNRNMLIKILTDVIELSINSTRDRDKKIVTDKIINSVLDNNNYIKVLLKSEKYENVTLDRVNNLIIESLPTEVSVSIDYNLREHLVNYMNEKSEVEIRRINETTTGKTKFKEGDDIFGLILKDIIEKSIENAKLKKKNNEKVVTKKNIEDAIKACKYV
jgi:hypothetical protein